jgi:asparagine synthase (glutamine-hydrolysing)
MCGIAGIISQKRLTEEQSSRIQKSIYIRGRDAQGHIERNTQNVTINLFHSRLAILDLDPRSDQPMSYKHIDVVFNGEIYNYQDLKLELLQYGYSFSTTGDTEVLIKAYHYWGEEVLQKLEGMFAFALLDLQDNTLMLARDRAGVKPLYYSINDQVSFSSNMSTIVQSELNSCKINVQHLTEYLNRGYVQAPNTLVDGVHKLLPGTYVKINLESFKQKTSRYWDIKEVCSRSNVSTDLNLKVDELRDKLTESLKRRLVTDCDIGVFLSSGYDSTTLLSILRTEIGSDINAFTLGFKNSEVSEVEIAAEIANYLGANHKKLYADLENAKEIFEKFTEIWDEPIADISCIPTALLCKETVKQVKVVLSADGADEVFAGYAKYYKIIRVLKLRDAIFRLSVPKKIRKIILKLIVRIKNNKLRLLLFLLFLEDNDLHEIFFELDHVFTIKEISDVMESCPDTVKSHINYSQFNDFYSDLTHLQVLTKFDFCCNQQENILPKIDKASMFYGIEIREPMLDTKIVELGFQSVDEHKLSAHGNAKLLIKMLNKKYLPQSLMNRPKKGFIPPLQHWFNLWFNQPLKQLLNDRELQKILNNCNIKTQKLEEILYSSDDFHHAKKKWSILILLQWLSHNKDYICR